MERSKQIPSRNGERSHALSGYWSKVKKAKANIEKTGGSFLTEENVGTNGLFQEIRNAIRDSEFVLYCSLSPPNV